MQKITPMLWFDGQAEEAAKFYVSLFKNSKITAVTRYSSEGPRPEGSVMTVTFELEGQEFTALNGGPEFKFTEAVSFVISCENQEEIDRFWDALSEGGEIQQCGWLKDRFGLSWQVIPVGIEELLSGSGEGPQRAVKALMQMTKLDIETLKQAHAGGIPA